MKTAAEISELAALSEKVRNMALDRFRLLQPHLEQKKSLRSVAYEAALPYRTEQRWVMRYQKHGLAALARKCRNDSGERRTLSPKIREIVEDLLGYSHEELREGFADGTFWPTKRARFPYMEEMLQ